MAIKTQTGINAHCSRCLQESKVFAAHIGRTHKDCNTMRKNGEKRNGGDWVVGNVPKPDPVK